MISEKSTQTLELPKILDQLARHTTFSAGAALARELHPSGIMDEAQTWQKETSEARTLLINKVNVTLNPPVRRPPKEKKAKDEPTDDTENGKGSAD